MSREFLCFLMMIGMGGCLGVIAGAGSPLIAYISFACLMFAALAGVMRHDEREFWRRFEKRTR